MKTKTISIVFLFVLFTGTLIAMSPQAQLDQLYVYLSTLAQQTQAAPAPAATAVQEIPAQQTWWQKFTNFFSHGNRQSAGSDDDSFGDIDLGGLDFAKTAGLTPDDHGWGTQR